MNLILLRHGKTEASIRRLYCGKTDLPLLPPGQDGLVPVFAEENTEFYTSGMLRAEQTLTRLFGPVAHWILPELQETDFGDFEMHSYSELKGTAAFQTWCTGDNERNRCPNGESGHESTERALHALFPLLSHKNPIFIVAHGGIISGVMNRWFLGTSRFDFVPECGKGFCIQIAESIPISYTPFPFKNT